MTRLSKTMAHVGEWKGSETPWKRAQLHRRLDNLTLEEPQWGRLHLKSTQNSLRVKWQHADLTLTPPVCTNLCLSFYFCSSTLFIASICLTRALLLAPSLSSLCAAKRIHNTTHPSMQVKSDKGRYYVPSGVTWQLYAARGQKEMCVIPFQTKWEMPGRAGCVIVSLCRVLRLCVGTCRV